MVEWEDSHGDGAWHQLDGEIEDRVLVCRSVGWLVLDGDRAKVVVPHLNEQETGVPRQGCGVMSIPARAVLRIVELTSPSFSSTCPEPESAPTQPASSPASGSASCPEAPVRRRPGWL